MDVRGVAEVDGLDLSALFRTDDGVEGIAGNGIEGGDEGGVELSDNGRTARKGGVRSL